MKTTTTLLLLVGACLPLIHTGVAGQEPPKPGNIRNVGRSYTSLDAHTDAQSAFPPGMLKFTDAELDQVLAIYQELSNRTIVRAADLPNVKITLTSQTQLTHREALQTLDTVLAANRIVMIPAGTQHMKAVPVAQAPMEGAPIVELPPDQLPDSGTYITYFIRLKAFEPKEAVHLLQPFARLPNSILVVEDTGVLVVRDYSANVRRMIQILGRLEGARGNARADKP